MKAWEIFRFEAVVNSLLKAWFITRPIVNRLSAGLNIAKHMIYAFLAYMHEWKPRSYFVIYYRSNAIEIRLHELEQGGITVSKIINVKQVQEIEPVLKELSRKSAQSFLQQTASIPIFAIIQSPDCEMKFFELNKIPFWKRWSTVRRVEKNLTQPEEARTIQTWIQKAFIQFKQEDVGGMEVTEKQVWFGVLKVSQTLAVLQEWLRKQKRPVIGARWAPIMQAEHVWKQIPKPYTPWTILILPYDVEGFQILVYHYRTPILYRQGFLNTFMDGSLQQEVQQTLRYIERFGYMQSSLCRTIVAGLDHMKNSPKTGSDWIWIPQAAQSDWACFTPPQSIFAFWLSWVKRASLKETCLMPHSFISNWMAYRLPNLFKTIAAPIIHLAFWAIVILWIKTNYITHTIDTIQPILNKQNKRETNLKQKMIHSVFFQKYLDYFNSQPSFLLQKLGKNLAAIGVANRISYEYGANEGQNLKLFFGGSIPKQSVVHLKKVTGETHYNYEVSTQGNTNVLSINYLGKRKS